MTCSDRNVKTCVVGLSYVNAIARRLGAVGEELRPGLEGRQTRLSDCKRVPYDP